MEDEDILAENQDLLPPQMTEEHRDVLIIHADDNPEDGQKALEVVNAAEEFCSDQGIHGSAVVFEDAVVHVTNHVDRLDEAVSYCTLILVIYSSALQADRVAVRNANAVLWNTIEELLKRGTFIPVIWSDVRNLPLLVRENRPLDMRKTTWRNTLQRLISANLSKRLDRQRQQVTEQLQYLRQNHPELFYVNYDEEPAVQHIPEPSENDLPAPPPGGFRNLFKSLNRVICVRLAAVGLVPLGLLLAVTAFRMQKQCTAPTIKLELGLLRFSDISK